MLIQYKVTLKALRPLHWPHFAGGRVRGAFGRALRQAACITLAADCRGCPLRNTCAYGQVFDPAAPTQALHPSFRDGIAAYVIQPPALGAHTMQPGDKCEFLLRLLPPATAHQSLLKLTLKAAVETHLFSPGDCALESLEIQSISLAEQAPASQRIALQWHTPLRLQQQGKPLNEGRQLDALVLVRAVLRRQLQWNQLSGQAAQPAEPFLQAATQCVLDARQLQWHEISRYSNTQSQKLPLDGLIGSAVLTGPAGALQTLQPLLQLGELLHIGKATVFGLGHYQMRVD